MKNDIVFIFTNFNNSEFTCKAVRSIRESDCFHATVIIVDNASEILHVNRLKDLEKSVSNVKVILNSENVGYFEGLNVGIRFARCNVSSFKYFVIGNNDLEFPADFAKSVEKCRTDFDKYPIVSPNIIMLDGSHQNPHVINGISKIREFTYDIYHSSYLLACLLIKLAKLTHRFTDRRDEQQHNIAQEIYQGYGACYILGPLFFEHFDELWAPTFLMYEEFFLSRQLEKKGFKTYYEPLIKVRHHCHASTGLIPKLTMWKYSRLAHKEYRKYVKWFQK